MTGASAVDRVTDWVISAIADGRLAAGQRLVELELGRSLGVGRNAVREAMQRLSADGIVQVERHRGPQVRRLDRADLDELFDIRERLEGLAARHGARTSHAGAGTLQAINAEIAAAAEDGDAVRFAVLNARFHDWLLDAAGGTWLRQFSGRLHLPLLHLQFRASLTRATMRASCAQHAVIVDAVARAQPAAAERAMRRHIRASRDNLRALPDSMFG